MVEFLQRIKQISKICIIFYSKFPAFVAVTVFYVSCSFVFNINILFILIKKTLIKIIYFNFLLTLFLFYSLLKKKSFCLQLLKQDLSHDNLSEQRSGGSCAPRTTSVTLGLCNFAGWLKELDGDCLNIGILKCN